VTSRAHIEIGGLCTQGSIQAFFDDVYGYSEDFAMPRNLEDACAFVPQRAAEALALLDMRLFNMDRHGGNLLVLGKSKPHGLGPIDHGCCLPPWWMLSEAIFDAWQDWVQLRETPSESARRVARAAAEQALRLCDMLKDVGLDESSILTHRLCTLFVHVGVGDLGLPIGRLAALMLRDDCQELSWLEERIWSCAREAGARIEVRREERYGDKALFVEDEGRSMRADEFLDNLQAAFRADLPAAVTAIRR